MFTRRFSLILPALVCALSVSFSAYAENELRVMVHSSFSLPKPLLAQFESRSGVKLALIKGGDAGEMLNKLILTKANPVADVVYGVDNTLMAKAISAGVLAPDSCGWSSVSLAVSSVICVSYRLSGGLSSTSPQFVRFSICCRVSSSI